MGGEERQAREPVGKLNGKKEGKRRSSRERNDEGLGAQGSLDKPQKRVK